MKTLIFALLALGLAGCDQPPASDRPLPAAPPSLADNPYWDESLLGDPGNYTLHAIGGAVALLNTRSGRIWVFEPSNHVWRPLPLPPDNISGAAPP